MKDSKIIIIGAGIGGLTLAISLQKNGFNNIKIIEKRKQDENQGSGISLGANAIKVFSKLGFDQELINAGQKIEQAQLKTDQDEILRELDFQALTNKFGTSSIGIHRNDLHKELIKKLKDNTIEFEQEFDSYTQLSNGQIEVKLKSGELRSADILIGADGLRSQVRKQLLGDIALRYSGYTSWRGICSQKNIKLQGKTSETWGCSSRFGIVPINNEQCYWYATHNLHSNSQIKNHKEYLLNIFDDWHYPIKDLIENTKQNDILHLDIYDFKPLQKWFQGNTVLIGDAIHATTPNLGQGASMAIESAYTLAKLFNESTNIQTALSKYQELRYPRTSFITNQSWQFGRFAQIDNPLLCKLRNFFYKLSPDSIMLNMLNKIYTYEI